jgi:FkbM family methyltransferase
MLSIFPELEQHGVDFVDLGCSGQLDSKWKPLFDVLNYVGFDPNKEECHRLASQSSPYRAARYMPYAIDGEVGEAVLYLTQSPYCSSLLKPRHRWLRRFSYHKLFEEIGEAKVDCVTLDHLAETENLSADIIKLDTQGLELPILRSATRLLQDVFCVESETGFVENYVGETVAAQVDEFMRENGFLMFDMTIHRVGRANRFDRHSRQQPLWCESLWMRDYLALDSWDIPVPLPDRLQALKSLYICRALGFPDYGLELARYFHSHGLLSDEELVSLTDSSTWATGQSYDRTDLVAEYLFRLLPGRWRQRLYRSMGSAVGRPHLIKSLLK